MISKLFSYRDCTGMTFKDMSAGDFSNREIHNSCFYQPSVVGDKVIVKDIFPDGIENLFFVRCNLDNVLLPKGAARIDGSNFLIQRQNDGSDWFLDENLNPIEPTDKVYRLASGVSINPIDIPETKLSTKKQQEFSVSIHKCIQPAKETFDVECPDCGVTHSIEKETGAISTATKPVLAEKEL